MQRLMAPTVILGLLAAASVVAGCKEEGTTALRGLRTPVQRSSASDTVIQHPGEAAFEDVSSRVPSFAGYFVENGNVVTYVTDASQTDAAKAAVRQAIAVRLPSGAGQILAHPVIVRPAMYTFRQLRDWRNAIEKQVLAVNPDVVWIDLDEVRNQVVIGLGDGSGSSDVENVVRTLGVTANAVSIKVSGRPMLNTMLWDGVRPLVGGLASAARFLGVVQLDPWCTFAFNAQYGGVNVILTASHCTRFTYALDTPAGSTVFYQMDTTRARIGQEWADPAAFGSGCITPYGYRAHCYRNSDAAMIAIDSGVSFTLGQIARTLWSSQTWGYNGSTIIDASNPTFTIEGLELYPAVGEQVQKMGWGTGWTSGIVRQTCVDEISRDGMVRLCQDRADYPAGGGDSGGPVFYWSGDGPLVVLVGIHWANDTSAHLSDFSPMGGVLGDFGAMTIYPQPPPPVSVAIAGPDSVRPNSTCTFTANASGGTEPYSYSWTANGSPVGDDSPELQYQAGTSGFQLGIAVTDAQGHIGTNALAVSVSTRARICLEQ